MITQYLVRRIATQVIEYAVKMDNTDPAAVGPFGPDNPAPTITPPCEPGCELIEYVGSLAIFNLAPSETSVLEWHDGPDPVWVERADVDALRARKNDEINAARLLANQSYFDFAGKEIACDEVSMLDIQCINAEVSLTRKMPADFPGYWKTRDNTYATISDVPTWTLFIQAMVTRGSAHFAHAQVLKAALAIATTPEQIASIDW